MTRYLVKRLILLVPTLLFVCIITFALLRMVPGSAVDAMVYKLETAGLTVSPDDVRHMLGLDIPAPQQFLNWLGGLLHGDLGDSLFQSEPVWDIIKRQVPVTLELGVLTLALSIIISIPLGILCAVKQDKITDNVIRVVSVILMSVPVFWLATLVLIYPSQWWGYAPPVKYASFFADPAENMRMFLVPALLGAIAQASMQLRVVRTMILETLRQDYIRTAWAKGDTERRVLYGHALRNAMIPIVTMIGGSAGMLIGGSVIFETMFNIPGIGAQVVAALDVRDYPLVQGCVLIFALFVMAANLLTDLAYKWIDPRVELE
jgi:peptide/nickel transport system permease protein